jgi:hypothetical protein
MPAPAPVTIRLNCNFSGVSSSKPGSAVPAVRLLHLAAKDSPNNPLFNPTGNQIGQLMLGNVTPAVLSQFTGGTEYDVTFTPVAAPATPPSGT